MSGKGDTQRPLAVDEQTFASNWERIFNQGKTPEPEKEVEDGE